MFIISINNIAGSIVDTAESARLIASSISLGAESMIVTAESARLIA
jgi:hypothetical protein